MSIKNIEGEGSAIGFDVPSDYYSDDMSENIWADQFPEVLEAMAIVVDCYSPDDNPTKHEKVARQLADIAGYLRKHAGDFDSCTKSASVFDRHFANLLYNTLRDRRDWSKRLREAGKEPTWEAWVKRQARIDQLTAIEVRDDTSWPEFTMFSIKEAHKTRMDDPNVGIVEFKQAGGSLNFRRVVVHKDGEDALPGNDFYPDADLAVRSFVDWELER